MRYTFLVLCGGVLCGLVAAGCSPEPDPEVGYLREKLAKADGAIQSLRAENFVLQERNHRMADAVNEVNRQLHEMRAKHDEAFRREQDLAGRAAAAEEHAKSLADALEMQARRIGEGNVDESLRRTNVTLIGAVRDLQTELARTRQEVDRLRTLCAKHKIDTSPDKEGPAPSPPVQPEVP
jgi:chromosome segregation ATPase